MFDRRLQRCPGDGRSAQGRTVADARGSLADPMTKSKGDGMRRFLAVVAAIVFAGSIGHAVHAGDEAGAEGKRGETLFGKHCSACHPGGGNIINSKRPIHRKALESRNIKTADDIVKVMRNPVQPMARFDEKKIPEADALAIAEYVLATFTK